jgi:hypothetical protein
MTAAAIATMATVEVATTTRRFSLVPQLGEIENAEAWLLAIARDRRQQRIQVQRRSPTLSHLA